MSSVGNKCPFCTDPLDGADCSKLYAKGCETINQIIKQQGGYIAEVVVGQIVHKQCRKVFCSKASKDLDSIATHQAQEDNPSDENCLFCGCTAKYIEKGRRKPDVEMIKTTKFIANIATNIGKRNDEWARQVTIRIQKRDLMNAVYHKNCNINFQIGKNIPLCHGVSVSKKIGRPQIETRNAAFCKIVDLIESEIGRIFSIKELVDIMQKECDKNEQIIENRYLKNKLLEHFGESLVVVSNEGKLDLLTLSQSVKSIITKVYEEQSARNGRSDKEANISKVANMIKSDVLQIPANKDTYPCGDTLSSVVAQSDFLPNSIRSFFGEIFTEAKCELKIASIGQAIVQAIRPRSIIAPLQLGLGVQLHHTFKSKFLVDTLYRMGFSSSYSEMVKFIADNIDHDTRTLDGKGTFRGMGMIAAFTPGLQSSKSIVRFKATIDDVKAIGQINILPYMNKVVGNGLQYEEVSEIGYKDEFVHTELLLKTTWLLRRARPSWSGIMQLINHGNHPGNSSIKVLPMIDLAASDPTCISSTLHLLCNEAEKHGITPIITFDQPLWWKASLIIQDEPASSRLKKIVFFGNEFSRVYRVFDEWHWLARMFRDCLRIQQCPTYVYWEINSKSSTWSSFSQHSTKRFNYKESRYDRT